MIIVGNFILHFLLRSYAVPVLKGYFSLFTKRFTIFQVPPSVPGLIRAIESKYKINARNIRYLYKKNKEGALVKLDDDMIKYYFNEDAFLMQVT